MATSMRGSAPRPPLPRSLPRSRVPPGPGRRSSPPNLAEAWEPLRRLALLLAVALLVGELMGAFAGIVLFVVGLTALAAYAAARPQRS
jgi:hypothetical protein